VDNGNVRICFSTDQTGKPGNSRLSSQSPDGANSLFQNIVRMSPLSARFRGRTLQDAFCKLLRINNLAKIAKMNRGSTSLRTTANSLFWNILPVSRVFPGFCANQQRSIGGKHNGINILANEIKK
jgi:hypothetical protein